MREKIIKWFVNYLLERWVHIVLVDENNQQSFVGYGKKNDKGDHKLYCDGELICTMDIIQKGIL